MILHPIRNVMLQKRIDRNLLQRISSSAYILYISSKTDHCDKTFKSCSTESCSPWTENKYLMLQICDRNSVLVRYDTGSRRMESSTTLLWKFRTYTSAPVPSSSNTALEHVYSGFTAAVIHIKNKKLQFVCKIWIGSSRIHSQS
jgi:hypothetical protein